MRVLKFKADGQRLKKQADCDFSGLVAGSAGYLRAEFTFSDDWLGCKKVAGFIADDKEYPVMLDDNDSCMIPTEALSGELFKVYVVGANVGYKIITNHTKVKQEVY